MPHSFPGKSLPDSLNTVYFKEGKTPYISRQDWKCEETQGNFQSYFQYLKAFS
jgi:hypothetical protein